VTTTNAVHHGIPTTHAGANFRSRLEARWAAFFDLIGWRWTYEPLDADGYIPDFLIHGKHPFFVEVGPCITKADYEAKALKGDLAAGSLARDLLIVGVSPVSPYSEDGCWPTCPSAGWLGEYGNFLDMDTNETEAMFAWGPARWAWTPDYGVPRPQDMQIWHDFQSYSCRPEGGRGDREEWPHADSLEQRWREAGNRVQWKP
jgi:hypothetical protein